jgi:hypothetical protein
MKIEKMTDMIYFQVKTEKTMTIGILFQVKGQSQERMNVIKVGATNLNNPDPVAVAIRYPQVFGTLGGGI